MGQRHLADAGDVTDRQVPRRRACDAEPGWSAAEDDFVEAAVRRRNEIRGGCRLCRIPEACMAASAGAAGQLRELAIEFRDAIALLRHYPAAHCAARFGVRPRSGRRALVSSRAISADSRRRGGQRARVRRPVDNAIAQGGSAASEEAITDRDCPRARS
jgi:hypothetical protein